MSVDLSQLYRQPALTTRLPFGKNWYKNNEIEFGLLDEISILPMTHKDEMLIHNPDALLTNNAIADIIKSCVPNIKDVKKLFMPDVEVLLLAIKIASSGNEIEVSVPCPHCIKTFNETKEEDRKKLIEDKKIFIEPQTFIFDARACLDTMNIKDNEYKLELPNKVILHLKPITLEDNANYELLRFKLKTTLNQLIQDQIKDNKEISIDANAWQEKRDNDEEFRKTLLDLDDVATKCIASSIEYLEFKNELITDNEIINEFLLNIPANYFADIRNLVGKINESALNKNYFCKCRCCNYEWEEKDIEFNYSNFFVTGS